MTKQTPDSPDIPSTLIIQTTDSQTAVSANGNLADVAAVANAVVAPHIFQKYLETKSENTIERHAYDLRLFTDYLRDIGCPVFIHQGVENRCTS